jgi:hypothetical protein
MLDYRKFGEHSSSAANNVIIQVDTYTANDMMRVVTRTRCLYGPPACFQLFKIVGEKAKALRRASVRVRPTLAQTSVIVSLVCNLT